VPDTVLPNGVTEDNPTPLEDPNGDGEGASPPNVAGAVDPKVADDIVGAGTLDPNGEGAADVEPLDPKKEVEAAALDPLGPPKGDAWLGAGATDPNCKGNVDAFGDPEKKGDGDGAFEPNVALDGAAAGEPDAAAPSKGLGTLYFAASF